MDSFTSYILRQAYEKVGRLGDRLAKIDAAVDWEPFRPIIRAMYRNDTPRGGRPNTDEVLMVKLLVLQQWYGLCDPELERQVADRISFQRFLGFPVIQFSGYRSRDPYYVDEVSLDFPRGEVSDDVVVDPRTLRGSIPYPVSSFASRITAFLVLSPSAMWPPGNDQTFLPRWSIHWISSMLFLASLNIIA